ASTMPNFRTLATLLAAHAGVVLQPETWHALAALLRTVSTRAAAAQPSPLYDTRALALRLEIADAQGDRAVLRREQQIHVRAADGLVLREVIWGDGRQLARYSVQG